MSWTSERRVDIHRKVTINPPSLEVKVERSGGSSSSSSTQIRNQKLKTQKCDEIVSTLLLKL